MSKPTSLYQCVDKAVRRNRPRPAPFGIGILSTAEPQVLHRLYSVVEIATHTGFPEMLDGRVKPRSESSCRHPRARDAAHVQAMSRANIPAIDLVMSILSRSVQTISAGGCTLEDAIENIDIGDRPWCVRGKKLQHEAIVTDPADYPGVDCRNAVAKARSVPDRYRLARKAFSHTATYDGASATFSLR